MANDFAAGDTVVVVSDPSMPDMENMVGRVIEVGPVKASHPYLVRIMFMSKSGVVEQQRWYKSAELRFIK